MDIKNTRNIDKDAIAARKSLKDETARIFGERLNFLLRDNKNNRNTSLINQTALAKALNTKPSAISAYTNGKTLPPIHNVIQIANLFQVSTDWLLGRDEFVNIQQIPDSTVLSPYTSLTLGDIARYIAAMTNEDLTDALDNRKIPLDGNEQLNQFLNRYLEYLHLEKSDPDNKELHSTLNELIRKEFKNLDEIPFKL